MEVITRSTDRVFRHMVEACVVLIRILGVKTRLNTSARARLPFRDLSLRQAGVQGCSERLNNASNLKIFEDEDIIVWGCLLQIPGYFEFSAR